MKMQKVSMSRKRSFSGSGRNRNNGSRFRKKNYNFRKKRRGNGNKNPGFNPAQLIAKLQNKPLQKTEAPEYTIENSFNDFAITQQLKNNIFERGYEDPTPIQDQIIPHIIDGRDVVGIANTGTGKTASFLIPLLHKVIENQQEKVLIIAPTRELAIQVRDELQAFSTNTNVRSALIIGGASINRQIESLKKRQQFVIGTPGRIKDLNQRKKLNYRQFTNIVLDEVDRMLDMGFVHEIKYIIEQLPSQRQSLFFSATMTDRVQEIMNGFLSNPVQISVKSQDTSGNVQQDIVKLRGRSKFDVLQELLATPEFEKVLVFGRTKHGTERLTRDLIANGFKVNAIHGNKSQSKRQRALKEFRNEAIQALIATDVVARGLDIDDVTHVINYDLPDSYEDYIHRIGRTGRAGKDGVALTFVE